tara:strand:+ start:1810 stop:2193 length:384 start_codon:yes stop_codon:yes gene_type:complete
MSNLETDVTNAAEKLEKSNKWKTARKIAKIGAYSFVGITSFIGTAVLIGFLMYGPRFPGEKRIIKEDERLGLIAAWDYSNYHYLAERNGLENPNDIKPGQEITIRDKGYKGFLQLTFDIFDYYYDRK